MLLIRAGFIHAMGQAVRREGEEPLLLVARSEMAVMAVIVAIAAAVIFRRHGPRAADALPGA